jgi:hypothetical protein
MMKLRDKHKEIKSELWELHGLIRIVMAIQLWDSARWASWILLLFGALNIIGAIRLKLQAYAKK